MTADERREYILKLLKTSQEPQSGRELAEKIGVSRQVIVGDMAILKARKEPILATSQGYIYMADQKEGSGIERTIACYHRPQDTQHELNILVDHGVFVKDVTVDHPIYGEFTAQLRISNRKEVKKFLNQLEESSASLLSELTEGIHLHTIVANHEEDLDEAEKALEEAGFLVDKKV
ncbi:transcription repressor NadR [Filobacillus milosensis]|uniref:Transcription repressor NadR n=2 Tax=Filobacillus milosensis TaxID=94137 RepID=A0A4Y8IQY6_9BACI|nr:transcription repressor NadR [Filobacillus milosensis]